MRTYCRPSARAMLLAMEVFPTPGGPAKRRMGPFAVARAFASTFSFSRSCTTGASPSASP